MINRETYRVLRRAAPLGVLLAVGACTISTPYKILADPPDPAAPVVVAVTRASLDPQRRAAFDRYTASLIDTLPKQPGLLGYSVRRELFGNDAWTMTVWRDDAARRAFVYSQLHQEAITDTYGTLVNARFIRYPAMPGDLPPKWADVLKRLDLDGRGY